MLSQSSGTAEQDANTQNNIPPQFRNDFGFIAYKSDGSVPWTAVDNIELSKEYRSVTDFLGIDCEMVGVGEMKLSVLGRVSIVNEYGFCIYDTFVNPLVVITDFRAAVSGIRAENLVNAPPIDLVVEQVANIVKGRILVGHSIHNDLEVLKLDHPSVDIRDTANFFQHRNGSKRTPSLKDLIKTIFNVTFQDGEHSSIQDAQATLKLYLLFREQWEKEMLERRRKANLADTVTDITCMHVQPRSADLFTESASVFIRPNKLEGAYYSSEEYKDVHFRLLLEDVLRPLRQDIRAFKQRRWSGNHFKNIRIATGNYDPDQPDFEVKSSKTLLVPIRGNRLEEVDWDDRNIFLAGSLLILTPDNFRTSKCAKVLDILTTPREDSVYLRLRVNFLLDGPSWTITEKDQFEMIESKAFFLPYEYTLNFLQDVDLDKFRMKKYIVDAVTKSDAASHLLKNSNKQIDFSILMADINSRTTVRASPLEYQNWPSAADLNLDQSQFEGLQKALTQELTIIQGPPGTGKSHVSLQIIKVLLTNQWLSPSPVLIVSYTNHALDELLEPILKFLTNEIHGGDLKKAEQSLLRFGGGCESDAIIPCTLKFKKEKLREQSTNKKLIKSLEKALLKVSGLDFPSKLIRQGIINFQLVPQIFLAKLQSNEKSNEIFKMWTKSHKQMAKNVVSWFGLSKQSLEVRPKSLTSVRDGMFVLRCENLDAVLRDTFPRIPSTWEELKGESLNNANEGQQKFLTRWGFYFYLVGQLSHIIKATEEKLLAACIIDGQLEHYVKENPTLQNAKVIGMTTTGAMKFKKLIETKLKSSVMLVEEAAHVLEAYVVASLTPHCTQLILIGDHKQLRPMIADHNLKESFLDVSLMERLVQNGIAQKTQNWTQLKVQHRMRTEIAKLISPTIYDELENHSDVERYPNVRGCTKNLFFVHHENPESKMEAHSTSRINAYEANYIIGLLSYFTVCGYLPTQITVISTYLAQKTLIENTIKANPKINQVQICTVDGYQGKQNDLIILSLVRSNQNGDVGFLQTDNRVCVALSRARHGLIMIGNMTILKNCSDTWSKINQTLVDGNSIGKDLPLTRPDLFKLHHTLAYTTVKPPSTAIRRVVGRTRPPRRKQKNETTSTRSAPSQLPLNTKAPTLRCGHSVTNSSKCNVKVREQLSCGHVRRIPCNEKGKGLKCGAVVQKTMKCGHTQPTACHKLSTAVCFANVKKKFSCGHQQKVPCQQMKCIKQIVKKLPCGHQWQVLCSEQNFKCTAVVVRQFPCGHQANGPCHTIPIGTCGKKAEKKKLSCGHFAQVSCGMNPSKVICDAKVVEKLKCGHTRNGLCSEVKAGKKTEKCGALVRKKMKCGHVVSVACHLSPNAACSVEVEKILSCGHAGRMLCSDRNRDVWCPGVFIHKYPCGHTHLFPCGLDVAKKCNSNVKRRLACGHTQDTPCHQNPVSIKCRHSIAVGRLNVECHSVLELLQDNISKIDLK